MERLFLKIIRYGAVTLTSYGTLLLGTFILVEILGMVPIPAYILTLTIVYIGVYFASSFYVFKSHEHSKQWKKYLIAVLAFWLLNALLYTILVELLSIQYLLSICINVLIFGPLRYFFYQTWVFKDTD